MRARLNDALVVVDVQKDFCPGGTLAVQGGDAIVPLINHLTPKFDQVVFTRDWHPADHLSFSATPEFRDKSWPSHCVADTPGASFCDGLEVPERALVIDKGTKSTMEAYSGFEGTNLAEELNKRGVERLFVCGLATDYCVKGTALDGVRHGFEVVLLQDACRGVDVPAGSADQAVQQMREAGVQISTSQAFQ